MNDIYIYISSCIIVPTALGINVRRSIDLVSTGPEKIFSLFILKQFFFKKYNIYNKNKIKSKNKKQIKIKLN
jgi:hypothetical protein